jgi:pSer/pThr/pTyr-binding forkhead associated (FHA) protein
VSSDDDSKQTLVFGDLDPDTRFWLRFGDHDVELTQGEMLLGRSPRCQVVLDDPLVSRQHARLVLNRDTVTLEDLDSVNGVVVNGERLTRARALSSGDRVVIGQQSFQLYAAVGAASPVSRRERFAAQTLSGVPRDELEKSESTHQADAFDMLAGVVEKVLALGRGDEAERILGNYLRALVQTTRAGGEVDPAIADKAALYAVRIAEATRKGAWVDYVFELFTDMKRTLPGPVVERLYTSLRSVSAINLAAYRRYVEVLQSVDAKVGPSERFVARRIRGLEALASTK